MCCADQPEMEDVHLLFSAYGSPVTPLPTAEDWVPYNLTFSKTELNIVLLEEQLEARHVAIYAVSEGGLRIRNFEAHGYYIKGII